MLRKSVHPNVRENVHKNKPMKTKKENIRKLTKVSGHSISITLPIEMVRDLGWKERQRVVVKRVKGGLLVRDYRSK